MEFKRALNTGDEYDSEIIVGSSNRIIWSYGSSDDAFNIHFDRGTATVIF
jgi:hypothetical protein